MTKEEENGTSIASHNCQNLPPSNGSWPLLGMDELFLRLRFPKRAQRVNWTNSSIILCPKSGHEPRIWSGRLSLTPQACAARVVKHKPIFILIEERESGASMCGENNYCGWS